MPYFLRRVKGDNICNGLPVWWAPDSRGYTSDITKAGLYDTPEGFPVVAPESVAKDARVLRQKYREGNVAYEAGPLIAHMAALTRGTLAGLAERLIDLAALSARIDTIATDGE